ncbi:hypothetical protein Ancab_012792 [Ancistrocladus abbreviatus]
MKIPSFLLLLCFGLLLQGALGDDHLFHFCSSDGTFTNGSSYADNLCTLENSLNYTTPWLGFGIGAVGVQDPAYGLALCRGDVDVDDCRTCVVKAITETRNLCPNNKGAIIWYDYCLLKYLDQDFFGKIDDQNKFNLFSGAVASNPNSFNEKTKSFLTQLSQNASATGRYYATGLSGVVDGSTRLYGLAQCTWDLSSENCMQCLSEIISELPSCCNGKLGARVFYGSCYIRFETYNFLLN